MEYALLGKNGRRVTVEEFMRYAGPEYKDKEIFPYCEACGERVKPYAPHDPGVPGHFAHQDRPEGADPLDDCYLSNRKGSELKGLQPDERDRYQSKKLKEMFCKPDNIAVAYNFMLKLCRKGNLPVQQFHKCLERADNKGIWEYKGIPLWIIPYILLTLHEFKSETYAFHFVFDKPSGTNANILWSSGKSCFLQKVFSNNGQLVKTDDNPLLVNQDIYLAKGSDIRWIGEHLLNALIPGS
jgi:hypothetical protein